MENIFIFVITVGTAIFISLPFLKKRFEESEEWTNAIEKNPLAEKFRELNSEKESIYATLKEFDFDYSMEKLSEEDYEELQNKYKARAVEVLKEIDDIKRSLVDNGLEEDIEREIRTIRKTGLTDNEEIEKEILKARKSYAGEASRLVCSSCGIAFKPDDRFCSKCGARLYV